MRETEFNPFAPMQSCPQKTFGGVEKELIVAWTNFTSADCSDKQVIQEYRPNADRRDVLEKQMFNYRCKIAGKIGHYPYS